MSDKGASSGSRASTEPASRLGPSGFDPERVAMLSRDQIDLLAMCPANESFVAADIPWSRPGPTGSALNRLAERGLLIRASDPQKWGRTRYIADPAAVAIATETRRAETTSGSVEDEGAGRQASPKASQASGSGDGTVKLREYYPPPAVDWRNVKSVKAWIEHVRWYAFFNGARHDEISRVEAEKLVEALTHSDVTEENRG